MGKNYASEIHANSEFKGCANCSTGQCSSGCHYGRDGIEQLEKLPNPFDTKPRWTPVR